MLQFMESKRAGHNLAMNNSKASFPNTVTLPVRYSTFESGREGKAVEHGPLWKWTDLRRRLSGLLKSGMKLLFR